MRDPGGVSGLVDEISETKLKDEVDGAQELNQINQPAILDKVPRTQSPPQLDRRDGGAFKRTEVGHPYGQNQLIDDNGQKQLSNIPPAAMTSTDPATTTQSPVSNVPGTTDLAAVEWSYVDIQGIVQGEWLQLPGMPTSEVGAGPFLADVMQAWHDQGYFTPDLLMKRTQIDTEWISVRDLTLLAAGSKIFLSPITVPISPGPPGLTRRPENLNGPLLHQRDSSPFGAPHQPVPIRSLRTPTLDSYINSNSQSASPSSSAGPATHIFGNPEPTINGIGVNRRPYLDASIDGLGRSPYSNPIANYGFNGMFLPSASGVLLTTSPRCSSRKYSRSSSAIVSHESVTLRPLFT